MRDTADHEGNWDDGHGPNVDAAVKCAGMLHDLSPTSVAAAYRAEDAMAETQN